MLSSKKMVQHCLWSLFRYSVAVLYLMEMCLSRPATGRFPNLGIKTCTVPTSIGGSAFKNYTIWFELAISGDELPFLLLYCPNCGQTTLPLLCITLLIKHDYAHVFLLSGCVGHWTCERGGSGNNGWPAAAGQEEHPVLTNSLEAWRGNSGTERERHCTKS